MGTVRAGVGDLSSIEKIEEAWLTAKQVAEFLGTTEQTLRAQAFQDPVALGFPVCVIGHSIKIPKEGFVFWCKHGTVRA
jgi:hypothetical protein